jgi:hypothetical protein
LGQRIGAHRRIGGYGRVQRVLYRSVATLIVPADQDRAPACVTRGIHVGAVLERYIGAEQHDRAARAAAGRIELARNECPVAGLHRDCAALESADGRDRRTPLHDGVCLRDQHHPAGAIDAATDDADVAGVTQRPCKHPHRVPGFDRAEVDYAVRWRLQRESHPVRVRAADRDTLSRSQHHTAAVTPDHA